MRQRLDAVGVDLLQLVDVVEDGAELAGHGRQLGVGQLQPGQVGDPATSCGVSDMSGLVAAYTLVGIWNGLRFCGRCTLPLRMHCTQTRMRWTAPPTWHWMLCRFGVKVRLLMPRDLAADAAQVLGLAAADVLVAHAPASCRRRHIACP